MNAFTSFLQGLHESRRRQAERELRRFAHLIEAPGSDRRPAIAVVRDEEVSLRLDGDASVAGMRA